MVHKDAVVGNDTPLGPLASIEKAALYFPWMLRESADILIKLLRSYEGSNADTFEKFSNSCSELKRLVSLENMCNHVLSKLILSVVGLSWRAIIILVVRCSFVFGLQQVQQGLAIKETIYKKQGTSYADKGLAIFKS